MGSPHADRTAADVSVVIPTYGRPDLCRSAVLSALGQTVRPREVLLVIDGEDASGYEDFECVFDDPALVLLRTGRLSGAAEARNIGVRAATSSWIAFLDDDDFFLPAKIERQLAAIDEAGLAKTDTPVLSTTAAVATRGVGVERWPGRPPLPDEPVEDFLFGLGPRPTRFRILSTCTLLVSRQLLLDVPMRGRAFDDWDWQIRASRLATTHHLDEVLTVVAVGGPGLTSSMTFADGKKWLESIRPIISDRAYAAACLTVMGRLAADKGTIAEAAHLLAEGVRNGAHLRQLAEFAPRVALRRFRRSALRVSCV